MSGTVVGSAAKCRGKITFAVVSMQTLLVFTNSVMDFRNIPLRRLAQVADHPKLTVRSYSIFPFCSGFYINAYYKSQRRAAMFLNGSLYSMKCTCRYIHPPVIKFIVPGIFLLFLFPHTLWYAIKHNVHGKQSSCRKAKWKPGVCTQPPTPSAGHQHYLHVNVAGK